MLAIRCLLALDLADTSTFRGRMANPYLWSMRWMRRRGDRVKITTGRYAGRTGTIESNVYQRTADYPDEWANGHHVMLDADELVTVRWDQVDADNAKNVRAGDD